MGKADPNDTAFNASPYTGDNFFGEDTALGDPKADSSDI